VAKRTLTAVYGGMSETSANSVVAVAAAFIALVSTYLTTKKASKDDVESTKTDVAAVVASAKELEHRLTVLETGKYNEEDRKCLLDTAFKVGVLWTSVLKDFPALMKRESTPRFDALLDKAKKNIHSLTQKEVKELITFLDAEYEAAKESTTPGRGAIAAFYRAVFKSELEGNGKDACK
jgi:hypothetical protein